MSGVRAGIATRAIVSGWLALVATGTAIAADHQHAPSKPVTLDTIRVDGQRPGHALPGAIDVLDATVLGNSNLHELTQLQDLVPTLRISRTGGRATPHYVSLRGFTNPWSAPESAVALYVDGVPVSDFHALDLRLFDVERIEVRKGPQGSAFGMNSEAGVIDIVTRAPDAQSRAWADVSLASRGGHAVDAGVSGALAPRLNASVAVSRDGSDGHVDNLASKRPYDAQWGRDLRGRLAWQPRDDLAVDLMLLDRKLDDRGGELYLPVDRAAFNQLPQLGGVQLGRFDQAIDHAGFNRLDSTLAALRARWQGAGVQWQAVASTRRSNVATSTDYDLSPQPWFVMESRYRIREAHAELRGESIATTDDRWHWLAGLSLDHRELHTLRLFHAGPGNPWGLPVGAYVRTDAGLPNRTAALFGESSWRFGDAQRWQVTAGARIERDRRELVFGPNALGAPAVSRQRRDQQFLPKLALDYRFTPTQLLYTSLARGGKAGGFNPGTFDGARAEYAPERTLAAEIGLKGSVAEGRVDYAVAAFANRIRDYQDLVIDERLFDVYVANARRASTRGVEGELHWQANEHWNVGAMLGTVQARYEDDVIDPASGFRLDGHPLQQVPRWNARLDVEVRQGPWWARVDLAGAGGFSINAYDGLSGTLREAGIPGHQTLGLHAGWRGAHWSLQLDADNLGNRRYFDNATFGFANLAGYPGAVGAVAPGRTLSLSLRRDF